jgi:putative ABC transport system permease protein
MFSNYLKTAFRNLNRNRFFSFINIFGLAVAMSVSMILIMLVADQLSFDRHNSNGDRIYRINTIGLDEKGQPIETMENASTPMTLGPELLTNYTGIESVVRFREGFGNGWLDIANQNGNVPLTGFFADANVFQVFQYELEYGNAGTALVEPYSVVLTKAAAAKLFKEENPIGQVIHVGEIGTYTVTGVLKGTNRKSHIVFEGLASMATVELLESAGKLEKLSNNWTNCWSTWTYVLAEREKMVSDVQSVLDQVYAKHIQSIATPGVIKTKFLLQPLFSITPGAIKNNQIGPQLPWAVVYFLGGLALLILLTSCFNFTNLSIARSLSRAREIGVRKVTGAARWQIFGQFISESVVIALLALVVAILLIMILEPLVLQLHFANMFRLDLPTTAWLYLTFIIFAIVVGILAGLFPSVILSGFQPVQVLKNLHTMKLFSRVALRKGLLVSQFTLSLFFILTVLIAQNQVDLFIDQDHGFNMKNNMLIKLNGSNPQNLKNELHKYANITSVTAASHLPAAGASYGTGFKRSLDATEFIGAAYFKVDEDYAANMNLTLVAGEFFEAQHETSNKNWIVINEVAVSKFQFKSPQESIGQTLIHEADSSEKIVIGVVANYNHRALTHQIEPLALLYDPNAYTVLQVGYQGTPKQAGETIENAWAAINPGLKVDYAEVKTEVNKFYDLLFGDLVKVLTFVSFLAILLSCLGLLGMATYATETRVKEVSIRKVLGSSDGAIVILLSRGFLSILALAIALGIPLSYFVNNLWLQSIAYRTSIGLGTISLAVLLLVVFGTLAIGSQTWRAVFVDPLKNLNNV